MCTSSVYTVFRLTDAFSFAHNFANAMRFERWGSLTCPIYYNTMIFWLCCISIIRCLLKPENNVYYYLARVVFFFIVSERHFVTCTQDSLNLILSRCWKTLKYQGHLFGLPFNQGTTVCIFLTTDARVIHIILHS